MGKGTEFSSTITAQPLTAKEIEERRKAETAGGQVETTFDGELVKRTAPSVAPRPVHKVAPSTWD
jgi:hypothetical protein